DVPDQAVLIDLPGRRLYFFFIEIWPQEVYYLTGLLILASIGLFLVTSVWGRAWCGYACPQTVWTDLFIAVERWIEGDRNARIRLDRARWGVGKLVKRAFKHATWIVIGILTGGAWVFYFMDAPTLLGQLLFFEAPTYAYIFIGLLTSTTYLLGGLAREQVCIYMCPWPRIQAAMVDEHTLTVSYRGYRGEPRGPHKKGRSWEGRGDCVDCKQCVAACPMGIDIRDGEQLECITCALCLDACDTVMDRVGRPRGLISYDTIANMAERAAGGAPRFRFLRARTIVYIAILLLVTAIMLAALLSRATLDISALADRNPLFVTLSDGSIRNGYEIKIQNKARMPRDFVLSTDGIASSAIDIVGGQSGSTLRVPADSLRGFRVLVTVPIGELEDETTPFRFHIQEVGGEDSDDVRSQFRGPAQ
ncbi:MAG: cytochrome c oxidase accessory protein CcoG, partial [Alphaproteobacteria bacterium]|nr:cytochrome c oxidase accessory protein CcoG [Alphaproteobacteria bacterium]